MHSAVRLHTGDSSPAATTSCGKAAKAFAIAAQASGSSSVSASTVITVSVSITSIAAFSARALPPCGTRSQRIAGWSELGLLRRPSPGSTRPKRLVSSCAVPSVEPSSAITICVGTLVWASSALRVIGSTAASLCAATMTPSVGIDPLAGLMGSGFIRDSDFHATNSSRAVS
jgi:hypothetical protein